ncbi:lycopene cyclase domain-containing protein [Propionibacterium cyclohexanicum]|uniref:Lycopene cyclase domain-containing protein n=1 Tax=Propionibacterium cyclohexanicum TaxID=64702 RepID=A0A1H9TK42_9ACTN|nr:lycopene cyclase domain-containing protein [Propionibacterium cyclohexanicum]SER97364.1 lycopene cyclase domain-containing protein [Propionibacterium cyclohexanicum]
MNYPALCLVFLAAAVLVSVLLGLRGPRPRRSTVVLTLAVMVGLTVVFDNAMIAAGLMEYRHDQLSGLHLGLVPVEDLGYPLAGAIAAPALWTALRARRRSSTANTKGTRTAGERSQ